MDDYWAELEQTGRLTGHAVCRCPSCGNRVMVSILNASGTSRWVKSGGGWPKCKQCRSGSRVEPISDIAKVIRVRPGHGPTERQAKRWLSQNDFPAVSEDPVKE